MPVKRKREAEPSFARLDVWARGEILGLHSAGIKREEICKRVVKADGTPPSLKAVDAVIVWLNINDREHAVALARNQKVRARAVLHQEGARTKW